MKKTLVACLLITGSYSASFGQATLTAANFNPQLNDGFMVRTCDASSVTAGLPGPNITWNFGGLAYTSTDSAKAISVASTGINPLFLALVSPSSNIAVKTPTTGVYTFSNLSTTKVSNTGFFQSTSSNTYYTDPLDQLVFPLTYNTKFSDTYAGYVTAGGSPIHGSGIVYDTCDGYGSLILPGVTSGTITHTNVLRVHSSQMYIDSANLFGNGIDTFQTETYTWYKPDYHSALLTINHTSGVGLAAGINYALATFAATQISNASVHTVFSIDQSLQLYPNPASNVLNIQFNIPESAQVRVVLTDMAGREAALVADRKFQGTQRISYNTNSLAKGLYLVQLQTEGETVSRKIEIQ